MPLEVFDAQRDIRNLFITPEIRSRIIRFKPGEVSHGHTHDLGHEMFVVLDGQAEFTIAGQSAVLGPGQICVARAGEWHEIRTLTDGPMTLYLSVTPHLEPTHTQWDREGGARLPYRYGGSTRTERTGAQVEPVRVLVDRHVQAAQSLATAAADYAVEQQRLAGQLSQPSDPAAARAVIDDMTAGFQRMYAALQSAERAWNDLAPAVAGD